MHVTASVLRRLGVEANAGENVTITLDFAQLMESMGALGEGVTFDSLVGELITNATQALPNVTMVQLLEQLANATNGTSPIVQFFLLQYNVSRIEDLPAQFHEPLDYGQVIPVDNLATAIRDALQFTDTFIVIDAVEKPYGKYPQALGNVVVLESVWVNKMVKDALRNFATDNTQLNILTQLVSPCLFLAQIYFNLIRAAT